MPNGHRATVPPEDHGSLVAKVEASQEKLQEAIFALGREFSSFSGSVLAQLKSLNDKVEKQNGKVHRHEISLAAMGAIGEHGEDFRISDRRAESEHREKESGWIANLIRSLSTVPRVVWGFLFALLGGVFLLISLVILTGQIGQLQPLVKTWAENRKPDIIIHKPEPVPSKSGEK